MLADIIKMLKLVQSTFPYHPRSPQPLEAGFEQWIGLSDTKTWLCCQRKLQSFPQSSKHPQWWHRWGLVFDSVPENKLTVSVYLYLNCNCLWIFICICNCICNCIWVSISVTISVTLYMYISVTVSVSTSISVSTYMFMCITVSISFSINLLINP